MAYRFMCYPGGVRKAVTFSYDDGCIDDLRLVEIFNRYKVKGTFNFNSYRLLNDKNGATVEDALKMIADGHEIAVHGKCHKANGISRPVDGIRDVLLCREELEGALNEIIRGMAYPDTGITNFSGITDYNCVKNYLTDLGIAYARTLGGDNNRFEIPKDWHAWMPTCHHNNKEIDRYIDEFISLDLENNYSAMRHPRLFYVWGHAYEFTNDDNWQHIESVCRKLGGRNDIWYATNIEIYDYVKAYNSLIWSADGNTVFNPSLYDLWFADDNKRYCVKSGTKLVINEVK